MANLRKAISLASRDIADALSGGRPGNNSDAMEQFLEAALWAAASAAESFSVNAWVDPRIDDGWTREAKSGLPPASISGDITDADKVFVAEALGIGIDGLLSQIPYRPDIHPRLQERFGPRLSIPSVKGDVGKPTDIGAGGSKIDDLLKGIDTEPKPKPEPELGLKPEPESKPQPPIRTGPDVPPVRKDTADRDNIKPRANEFESSIPMPPIGKQPI